MSMLLRWWRQPPRRPVGRSDDSAYYATRFVGRQDETQLFVHWAQRAPDLGATAVQPSEGVKLLTRLMGADRGIAAFDADQLAMLSGYLEFTRVGSGKQVMGQGEQGDFLMVVLEGVLAETRMQPAGEPVRLCEGHPGDLLGDLTALDSESRASSWTALVPSTLAVVSNTALEHMMQEDPWLAAELLAWMGKRTSLRLREAHVRLAAQLNRQ